jgi:hypothetical protein
MHNIVINVERAMAVFLVQINDTSSSYNSNPSSGLQLQYR